jgi:hypothetical protein
VREGYGRYRNSGDCQDDGTQPDIGGVAGPHIILGSTSLVVGERLGIPGRGPDDPKPQPEVDGSEHSKDRGGQRVVPAGKRIRDA